jgi:uncharacterized membrane protein YhaH (DUF805 family)
LPLERGILRAVEHEGWGSRWRVGALGEGWDAMGFTEAIRAGFDNYVNFNGRASRPAYWWWVLFGVLVTLVTRVLDGLIGSNIVSTNQFGTEVSTGIITSLAGLALLLPSISVLVRRLHDTDRSGWWYWIVLIPILGWLVLLFFLVSAGTPTANRYGPPPSA